MANEEYVQCNLRASKLMEEAYNCPWLQLWRERDWKNLIHDYRFLYGGGKCVECGSSVTAFNLKFYNFNVTKVKCWDCQHK